LHGKVARDSGQLKLFLPLELCDLLRYKLAGSSRL